MAQRKGPAGARRTGPTNTYTTANGNTAVAHALRAARRGWPVVPTGRDKRPLIKDWPHRGSFDDLTIRNWAKSDECTGFATVTGSKSGVVVVDVDYRNGGDEASLDIELPPTMTVDTPGPGKHYYYVCPNARIRKRVLAPGIDLLAGGALATLPGSLHPNGGRYRLVGRRRAVAPLPQELIYEASEGDAGLADATIYTHGTRNVALTRLAGKLRYAGASEDEMRTALSVFNRQRCHPSLEDREVEQVATSIAQRDDATTRALVRERARQEARALLAAESLHASYVVPPPGRTLADDLAEKQEPLTYTIAELHVAGGNTLLVASYKTGKTVITKNLAATLADGEPFLGRYAVTCDRRIGILQYELTEQMSLEWMRELAIAHPERISIWQLRGHTLPFWADGVKEDLIDWCRDNEIGFLIVDPAARAWRGLVESEGANIQIAEFYLTLDEVKRRAGVQDLLVTTHTPRAVMAENQERARAGSASEDWMDHGWYLTKDVKTGVRSLRAMGRGVDVPARDLQYDAATRRYTDSGYARSARKDRERMEMVVDALSALRDAGDYPALAGHVTKRMKGAGDERHKVLADAVATGYVTTRPGKGRAVLHSLSAKGEKLQERRPERRAND